jgi:hypothetical protein
MIQGAGSKPAPILKYGVMIGEFLYFKSRIFLCGLSKEEIIILINHWGGFWWQIHHHKGTRPYSQPKHPQPFEIKQVSFQPKHLPVLFSPGILRIRMAAQNGSHLSGFVSGFSIIYDFYSPPPF